MKVFDTKRKKILIVAIFALLLTGCTVPTAEPDNAPIKSESSNEQVNEEDITGVISSLADGDTYNVVISKDREVRDGVQLTAGEEITVRLLLVDTPESVGEKAGMPYGDESSSYAKGLLQGKKVTIEFDDGDIKDKYDRYLAYIYVDGKRVQDYLVENGYAMIRYVYEPNTRYLSELQELEADAERKSLGIWSIEGYVDKENGFNEVNATPNLQGIGEDIAEKAQETAEDLFSETMDSLLDSINSN